MLYLVSKYTQKGKPIMSKRSHNIETKLDSLFSEDQTINEFEMLISGSNSPNRFHNQSHFVEYLCEGALLNITQLASNVLSIPSGEYLVWVTDVGHTMLVPTRDNKKDSEVLEHYQDRYEILTSDLLKHWNKMERTLSEEDKPWNPAHKSEEHKHTAESGNEEETDEKNTDGEGIQSRVNPADIDRTPILQAMEDRGYTVTSLASATGVQPPAISRLLRIPKDTQGDPGGRNPSIGLAAKISKVLRMDPTALFPDIFGASGQKLDARDQPGNRGSGVSGMAPGSSRKGAATEKWTQGNS